MGSGAVQARVPAWLLPPSPSRGSRPATLTPQRPTSPVLPPSSRALWYYGAYEKIVGGNLDAPAGIEKSFAGSVIDTFPGVGVAWVVIALAEAAIVVGLLASLVRGEFLRDRAKPILLGTLAGSIVVLGALLFGQSMIGEHDSVASLFTYGAGTLVMMAAVVYLSPGSRSR
jgi:hypothetical protein